MIVATSFAVSDGFAAHTSAAVPATCGAANDVPLPKPYRPADAPGSATRGNVDSGDNDDSAPNTFRPGAATSTCRPTLEKSARSPEGVDAATTSPLSPRSAAGYSTEFARGPLFPAAATSKAPFEVAYAI